MSPAQMLVSSVQLQPPSPNQSGASPWNDAAIAAALVVILKDRLGGIRVSAQPGPVRDFWLSGLEHLSQSPLRKVPSNTAADRLLGGMDITESMRLGKPILAKGVLAESHGRLITIPMCERLPKELAGHWCAALDTGEVHVARDGISETSTAAITVIALDEGIDEEAPPEALTERLALAINLDGISVRCVEEIPFTTTEISKIADQVARARLLDDTVTLLAQLAASMGIHSTRTLLFAVNTCKALSLLLKKSETDETVIGYVIRLVLLPRANRIPAPQEESAPEETNEAPDEEPNDSDPSERQQDDAEELVRTEVANLPPDLLATLLKRAERSRQRQSKAGSSGQISQDKQRGRPVGVRRGDLKRGHRIDIPATLRTAAPFQAIRSRWDEAAVTKRGLYIEPSDIRVKRFEQRKSSVMIFAVDASGSSAHQRMSEAKGAIELILADCYSHRTEVALIAFKGECAELLLPPTRSLVRAKRTLAQLPGGGGTPMGAAIQATHELALAITASGATPSYVLLTDGAANVARDGTKSRSVGTEDALNAAKMIAGAHYRGVLVDTAVRPSPRAQQLAQALDATYLPLPNASAQAINDSVRALSRD